MAEQYVNVGALVGEIGQGWIFHNSGFPVYISVPKDDEEGGEIVIVLGVPALTGDQRLILVTGVPNKTFANLDTTLEAHLANEVANAGLTLRSGDEHLRLHASVPTTARELKETVEKMVAMERYIHDLRNAAAAGAWYAIGRQIVARSASTP